MLEVNMCEEGEEGEGGGEEGKREGKKKRGRYKKEDDIPLRGAVDRLLLS